jgi:Acetoacetate decarboxylase (ADC)
MGYVKTAAEIAAAQKLLRNLEYEGERVKVLFQTDPDFIRDVLPPCFSPAPLPRAMATVTRSRSDGEDSLDTSFVAASIFVRAMFGEVEGWHHLSMFLTGDMTVTIGREMFGEAKKRAQVELKVEGSHVHGYAERHGVRLVDIEMEYGADLGPRVVDDHFLDLKCFLDAQALDLEYDPIVIVAPYHSQIRTYREGQGTVTLRTSPEDACGTVPVLAIDSISYDQHHSKYLHADKQQLDGRDGFLPYVMGRSYDFSNVT